MCGGRAEGGNSWQAHTRPRIDLFCIHLLFNLMFPLGSAAAELQLTSLCAQGKEVLSNFFSKQFVKLPQMSFCPLS